MQISIIIPTWNRKALLAACLDSLAAQSYHGFETIVVDDGSTDGTVQCLADAYSQVRVVSLERNSGFAAAVNAGIRHARGDWLFLLNNDMTLEPTCLERLWNAANEGRADLLAPLVLFKDQPERIYGAGDCQRVNGRPEAIGHGQPVDAFAHPPEVFGVSAGAALYRRAVFDAVGLFDESFGAYFEDSDLNFRARLAGFTAAIVREARAYHLGSASLDARHLWRARQCCRNHLLLVVKNMPASLLLRHARAISAERIHQYRRLFTLARAEGGSRRALAVLGALWLSTVRLLPHALSERIRIQRRRKRSAAEVDALLTQDSPHD